MVEGCMGRGIAFQSNIRVPFKSDATAKTEGWGGDILKLMCKRQPIKDDILPDGGSAFVEGFGGH